MLDCCPLVRCVDYLDHASGLELLSLRLGATMSVHLGMRYQERWVQSFRKSSCGHTNGVHLLKQGTETFRS